MLVYAAGKRDWLAFGLPAEGHGTRRNPLAGTVARRDVPTCRPEDRLSRVRWLLRDGWTWCIVTNHANVVVGRVRRRHLEGQLDRSAEDIMDLGPSTYRPSIPIREMVARLQSVGTNLAILTRADGTLVGLFDLQTGEDALRRGEPSAQWGIGGARTPHCQR